MATQLDSKESTLGEAYEKFKGDQQKDIPFLVWLLENPDSPLPFPGQIRLFEHDCLHLILGLGISASDEAFIVGFTMGNDPNTKTWHMLLFRLIARCLYPEIYRFNRHHISVFNYGFKYGRQLKVQSLNTIDLLQYIDHNINEIREEFGIDVKAIHLRGCLRS